MVNMKTDKCPRCGDVVFKLAGKAGNLCHDLCLKCRDEVADEQQALMDNQ